MASLASKIKAALRAFYRAPDYATRPLFLGDTSGIANWPVAKAGAPLVLSAGCDRCGEPLDKNARGHVCGPCVTELESKRAAPPPPVQVEWWHEQEEEEQTELVYTRRAA